MTNSSMLKAEVVDFLKTSKRAVNRVVYAIDLKLIPLFASNGFLASIYYAFFSRAFQREHLSVLRGRLSYLDSLTEIKESSVLLRRNVHRLEKGLIMRPRRDVFAKAYISETVDCYVRCQQAGTVNPDEMKWARDVMSDYFNLVSQNDEFVAKQRDKFLANTCHSSGQLSKPYSQAELPAAPMSFDELFTLFQRRRSVRWYNQQPVPRSLIEQAVGAASLAPSACNRQPYRFVFFDNPAAATEVASLAMGTAGFSDQLPSLFAVVGDLSCYPKERDRHLIYIDAALASMQLMLALETVGLSSCPINWPDIEKRERKMAKKLCLNMHERVVMLIAAGYADPVGGVPYSQKKTAATLMQA